MKISDKTLIKALDVVIQILEIWKWIIIGVSVYFISDTIYDVATVSGWNSLLIPLFFIQLLSVILTPSAVFIPIIKAILNRTQKRNHET